MTQPATTSRWSRLAAVLAVLASVTLLLWAFASGGPDADSSQASVAPAPGGSTNDDDSDASRVESGSTTTPSVLGSTTTLADNDPATLYVSPSGSDANSGQSPEIAFATIEHAIRSTKTGMTLFVMDGTFTLTSAGPTQIAFRREGSPTAWTRIVAAPGATPVIVATEGTAFEPSGSYIEVSGLTIRGESFSQSKAWGVGILVADGHHFTVADNTVSGFPVGGIAAVRASHLRFERNVVFDNSKWGPEQGSGLSTFDARNYGLPDDQHGYTDYFIDNAIYRNENLVTSKWVPGNITDGNGIIIDTNIDTGYSGRTLIANNIIVDNGGRSITIYKSQRVDIVNNSTFANGRTGAALLGGGGEVSVFDGRDVRLSNNLLWNDGTWPTLLVGNSSNITATANAFVGGGVQGIATDGNVVIASDPGLVSSSPGPDAADFLLTATSPLVDAGVAVPSIVARDFLGNARQVGASVDIGAVEWASGAPTPERQAAPPPTPTPAPAPIPAPTPQPAPVAPAPEDASDDTPAVAPPIADDHPETASAPLPKPGPGLTLSPEPATNPGSAPAPNVVPTPQAPAAAPQQVAPTATPQPLVAVPVTSPAVAAETAPTPSDRSTDPSTVSGSNHATAGDTVAANDDPSLEDPTPDLEPLSVDDQPEPLVTDETSSVGEPTPPEPDEFAAEPVTPDRPSIDLDAAPPGSLAYIESTSPGGNNGPSTQSIAVVAGIATLAVGLRAITQRPQRL